MMGRGLARDRGCAPRDILARKSLRVLDGRAEASDQAGWLRKATGRKDHEPKSLAGCARPDALRGGRVRHRRVRPSLLPVPPSWLRPLRARLLPDGPLPECRAVRHRPPMVAPESAPAESRPDPLIAIRSTDRVTQERAIDDLARQGPSVLPEVELLLTDPDPRMKYAALQVLVRLRRGRGAVGLRREVPPAALRSRHPRRSRNRDRIHRLRARRRPCRSSCALWTTRARSCATASRSRSRSMGSRRRVGPRRARAPRALRPRSPRARSRDLRPVPARPGELPPKRVQPVASRLAILLA